MMALRALFLAFLSYFGLWRSESGSGKNSSKSYGYFLTIGYFYSTTSSVTILVGVASIGVFFSADLSCF
jgi:hypothetical protein